MKWTRISLLTLLLAAFVLALPVAAQETTTDLQTFTTEDGRASVQFPANWISELGSDSDSILTLKLANSPAALEKELFNRDDVFESGEVHIEVATIALAELASDIPGISTDSTPADILDALTSQGMPDEFEFGASGEITINDISAVRVNLTAPDRGEGQLLLTVVDHKWVVAIILYAAPGEGDKWDIIARDILGSVVIDEAGTAQPEMLTYTSHVGGFTVSYPETWNFDDRSADTSDDVIGGVFASNRESQSKQIYSDVFESGDFVVELSIADLAKLQTLPALAEANADTTAEEVAQALVDIKAISDEVEYGEVEILVSNMVNAAVVDLTYRDNGEGRMLILKRDDGYFVYAAYFSAVGELPAAESFARSIVSSLVINPPKPDETPEPVVTAEVLELTNSASNGIGTVNYPATWFSREYSDADIYVGNTEIAVEKSFGRDFESGEVNILYSFSTVAEFIEKAKLPLTPDASPVELLEMTVQAVEDGVEFSPVEETTIAGKPAARVDFSTPAFEGTAWAIIDGDRVIAVQLMAAVGEVEQWQQIALDISETAAFLPE